MFVYKTFSVGSDLYLKETIIKGILAPETYIIQYSIIKLILGNYWNLDFFNSFSFLKSLQRGSLFGKQCTDDINDNGENCKGESLLSTVLLLKGVSQLVGRVTSKAIRVISFVQYLLKYYGQVLKHRFLEGAISSRQCTNDMCLNWQCLDYMSRVAGSNPVISFVQYLLKCNTSLPRVDDVLTMIYKCRESRCVIASKHHFIS